MKKIKYKIIIAGSFVLAASVIAACKKSFLDKPSIGTLDPSIVATEKGVQGILIGAYSLLDGAGAAGDGNWGSAASNWVYGGVAADEAYKGSDPSDIAEAASIEAWNHTPTNPGFQQKWNACYAGAQRSNDVLRTLPLAKDIPADEAKEVTAEARFLRAFYHMELQKMFNKVPYVDENVVVGSEKNLTNTEEMWPKIEADLQAAIADLPETQPQPGRVNVWAARAFLAKAYLFQGKYQDAKALFDQIIPAPYGTGSGKTANGKTYALMPNYFSNFNPAQKNNAESVFQAQMSVQDGSSTDWGGDPNGNYGDILNFPYNGGPGACCGFYNPSQDLVDAYKTDATGLPLLDTWYQGKMVSDPVSPYSGTLDPRVDWTAGRPGIPYLDWGAHPGDDWIRNPSNDGHFSPKKNVYAKSQTSSYTDAGSNYWGPNELTANNVNLLRFADVLLMDAEVEAQLNNLPRAMQLVNYVRDRATNSDSWVYKNSDYDAPTASYKTKTTPADNYKIGLYTSFPSKDFAMKAIIFERRLELGMEGHRFFDLQRWDKNGVLSMADVLNAYAKRTGATRVPYMSSANFTKGKNEYFPIPQSEIDLMNADGTKRLNQNPNY